MTSPYESFAEIYEVWTDSAPVTAKNLPFYVEEYLAADGPVCELGVGNGRIAIEAARQGRALTGVDSSASMLELAHARAAEAGVADRIDLIEADMRSFELPEPAALCAIPFHTIGHLLTHEDKREGLAHIRGQTAPCGRLVFDHFVFDPDRADARDGVPRLRAEFRDEATGRDTLLWVTSLFDHEARIIRIVTWTEAIEEDGTPGPRRYRLLDFSWIQPVRVRALLEETGWEVEALWGGFEKEPFTARSDTQVWVARNPG